MLTTLVSRKNAKNCLIRQFVKKKMKCHLNLGMWVLIPNNSKTFYSTSGVRFLIKCLESGLSILT